IEAIPLGQKMFKRARPRLKNFVAGTVLAREFGKRRAAMRSLSTIDNPAIPLAKRHPCAKIRQMKPGARNRHRDGITRIKTERPNPGLAAGDDEGAHSQRR